MGGGGIHVSIRLGETRRDPFRKTSDWPIDSSSEFDWLLVVMVGGQCRPGGVFGEGFLQCCQRHNEQWLPR